MEPGADVPGRVTRLPGGVALNIAVTLARFGLHPAILSAVGHDGEGEDLLAAAKTRGVECRYVLRLDGLPTDRYMAIESAAGMMAAVADARTLEAAGAGILAALVDGRLGSADAPWTGLLALDGNLTETVLDEIANSSLFAAADVRIASAGSGKAQRLRRVMRMANATLYLNLEEASVLLGKPLAGSEAAVKALLALGAHRVLVTDGAHSVTEGRMGEKTISALPPRVAVTRLTGAGDTFMGAHILAEYQGLGRKAALERALQATADYISGEIGS